MRPIRIVESREAIAALNHLYALHRANLSAAKQAFVSSRMPLKFAFCPGFVCFEHGRPAAAVLWDELGLHPDLVLVSFYGETPGASQLAITMLLERFLEQTSTASCQHFEVWTRRDAQIHAILNQKGFDSQHRELLAISKAPRVFHLPAGLKFIRLQECCAQIQDLRGVSAAVYASYLETPDGNFYPHFSTPQRCRQYLERIINSAFCDVRNSWLALSQSDNRVAGMALCAFLPSGRSLYLEQLSVVPEFRRCGAGRSLLCRVSEALRDRKARSVLLTVTTANATARRLYYDCGASLLDQERAYVKGKTPGEFTARVASTLSRLTSGKILT